MLFLCWIVLETLARRIDCSQIWKTWVRKGRIKRYSDSGYFQVQFISSNFIYWDNWRNGWFYSNKYASKVKDLKIQIAEFKLERLLLRKSQSQYLKNVLGSSLLTDGVLSSLPFLCQFIVVIFACSGIDQIKKRFGISWTSLRKTFYLIACLPTIITLCVIPSCGISS